jgi:hypothetical protein
VINWLNVVYHTRYYGAHARPPNEIEPTMLHYASRRSLVQYMMLAF